MGNVDPGYWLSAYVLNQAVDPESYTPILNASVIALSMALARPLLNSFQLLIFTIFATASFSFFQSIILLPRQFIAYFIWQIAAYCFLVSREKNHHFNIFYWFSLAISFHWSTIFPLAMWLSPRVVEFFMKNKFKISFSSIGAIILASFVLYVTIRLNLTYKILIYLSSNSENDLNTGLLSFFLPFLLLLLIKNCIDQLFCSI